MNRNLILEQLRNDYIKHIDSDDKKNQYFKIGEISYLNIKKEGIEILDREGLMKYYEDFGKAPNHFPKVVKDE